MEPIFVTGHTDKNGKLTLDQLPPLEPDQDLRVLVMDAENVSVLWKMLEIVSSVRIEDPVLLEQLEALDEALWDMQFANSQDVLAKLAEEARREYKSRQK